jgi:hypothetical protein
MLLLFYTFEEGSEGKNLMCSYLQNNVFQVKRGQRHKNSIEIGFLILVSLQYSYFSSVELRCIFLSDDMI